MRVGENEARGRVCLRDREREGKRKGERVRSGGENGDNGKRQS